MDPPRPVAHWTTRIAALEDELSALRAAAAKESGPIPLRAPPTPAAATGDATFLLALLEREMRRNDDLERKLDDARAAKIDLLIENGHLRTRLQVAESMLAAARGRTDRDDTADRSTAMPPSRRSSSAPGGDKKSSSSRRISSSTEDRLRFLNLLDSDTLPLRGDSSSPGSDAESDSDMNDASSSRTPSRRSIGTGGGALDDPDTPPHRRVRSLSRDSVVSDLSSAELRLIKDRDRRLSTRNADYTPSPAASPATTASSAAPPMDLSGQELRMLVKRHSRDDILNIASPMAASPISGNGSGSASVTFGIGTPGGGAPPSDLSASERKILTKRGSREHVAMVADSMPVVARRLSSSRRGSQDLLPTVGNGAAGHAARSGDSLISDLSTAELRLLPGVADSTAVSSSPHDAITSDDGDDENTNHVENDPLEAGYRRVHMSKENLVSDLSNSEKKLLVKPNHGAGSGAASPLAPVAAGGVVPGDVVLDSSTRLLFHDPLASIHAYNAVMPADPIQVPHHSHHRMSASPGPSGGASTASPLGTRTGSSSNLAASGSPAGSTHERKVVILARDSEAGSRESLASVGRHVAFATADEEHVVAAADSDDEHAVPRKVVAFAAGATAGSSGLGRASEDSDSGADEDGEGREEDRPRSRVVSFGDLVEASSNGAGAASDAGARTTPPVTLSNRTLDSIPDEGTASETASAGADAAGLATA
ncbi:hypothetical protein GGF31_002639 [Allomyces arbusculus]|nr:hypothetical protein GGF31_002639 [Allomyces arbusculus]